MSEIFNLFGQWLDQTITQLRKGVTVEEIAERMKAPGSVGRQLLEAIGKRKDKFDEYVKNG